MALVLEWLLVQQTAERKERLMVWRCLVLHLGSRLATPLMELEMV